MAEVLRLWLRRLIPFVILAAVVLIGYGNLAFIQRAPAQSPFVARWTGLRAWLTQGTSPYDPSVSADSQIRIYGRPANPARGEDPQHFLYPPAIALFLGPLALLPLQMARAVWMTILQVALVGLPLAAAWSFRWSMTGWLRAASVAMGLFSLPGFLAVLHGDVSVVVTLAIVLSLVAVHRRREAAAGLLAAAAVVKPQLAFLFVPYLYVWGIHHRRWILIGWMTTGLAVLLGLSTVLLPTWPVEVARQVLDYSKLETIGSAISPILGTAQQPYSPMTWIASAALLGYLLWEWRLSLAGSERSMMWTAMLTLTLTTALSPFSVLANQVLLIPPLLLAVCVWNERLRPAREGLLATAIVGLALVTWAGAGPGVDPADAPRLAIVLPPILVGGALWWVRWWATRPPLVLESVQAPKT